MPLQYIIQHFKSLFTVMKCLMITGYVRSVSHKIKSTHHFALFLNAALSQTEIQAQLLKFTYISQKNLYISFNMNTSNYNSKIIKYKNIKEITNLTKINGFSTFVALPHDFYHYLSIYKSTSPSKSNIKTYKNAHGMFTQNSICHLQHFTHTGDFHTHRRMSMSGDLPTIYNLIVRLTRHSTPEGYYHLQ